MSECMLTTFDNPFNPLIDFSNWYKFDNEKGYGTCEMLARVAKTSDDLTDSENEIEIERACDEIIKCDFMQMYYKIRKEDKVIPISFSNKNETPT